MVISIPHSLCQALPAEVFGDQPNVPRHQAMDQGPSPVPSLVTADTTEIHWNDDFLISDMSESEIYHEIARILRHGARAFDVRHFDSAYKSRSHFFISEDRNYASHSVELFNATKIRVIDPSEPNDVAMLLQAIQDLDTVHT